MKQTYILDTDSCLVLVKECGVSKTGSVSIIRLKSETYSVGPILQQRESEAVDQVRLNVPCKQKTSA
jgi:hypothetical protein